MLKEEFYYDSRDKKSKVHAIKWEPEGEIKCILQIVHGMAEHIDRYDEFASYMAKRGVLVVGNDHLGHGKTAMNKESQGYFAKKDGVTILVKDIHRLKKIMEQENIGKPYFLLGHSMGSFLTRVYLTRYGSGIQGGIIVGTGYRSALELMAGKGAVFIMARLRGWNYRSSLIDHLAFARANKRIRPKRTRMDWLSRDRKVVDKFLKDEYCGFTFTLNGFFTLFQMLSLLNNKKELKKMPKDLPVCFLAGLEDPIGNFGKGVKKVYGQFQSLGMKNISLKLYKQDRHEILNEPDRMDVYKDIYHWLLSKQP